MVFVMGFNYDLGTRIKSRLKELGISAKQLAGDTDLPINTIGRIIRGEVDPGISKILLIASVLDVSLDWLVFGRSSQGGAERGGGAYPGARRPAAGFPGAACSIIQALPAQEQEKVYNILLILYGDTKAD